MFGSFFEQDHLLNFIILVYVESLCKNLFKFMWKDDLNVHVFQHRSRYYPKFDPWFLFLKEDWSTGRILSEKNVGVPG